MTKQVSKQILDLISNNTDNSVIITNDAGVTTWVNEGFYHVTGFAAEEIIGKTPGSVLQGELTDEDTLVQIREALASKKEFSGDLLNYRKEGNPYWINLRIIPFKNEDGELHFFGITKDITKEILQRSSLVEEESIYKLMLENSNEIVSLSELDGTYIYVSPSCKKY